MSHTRYRRRHHLLAQRDQSPAGPRGERLSPADADGANGGVVGPPAPYTAAPRWSIKIKIFTQTIAETEPEANTARVVNTRFRTRRPARPSDAFSFCSFDPGRSCRPEPAGDSGHQRHGTETNLIGDSWRWCGTRIIDEDITPPHHYLPRSSADPLPSMDVAH